MNKVWMQPGSESEKAINFCKENNIEVIYNSCIMVKSEYIN
ncbi:MAG: CoA-binding protein [Candidatus Woesearchaeota archaeon]